VRGKADSRTQHLCDLSSCSFCCIMTDLDQMFTPESLGQGFLESPGEEQ
jgi:hypothetical protein